MTKNPTSHCDDFLVESPLDINDLLSLVKLKIPHHIVSGVPKYGIVHRAKSIAREKIPTLKIENNCKYPDEISAMDLIIYGFRTRTTRSVGTFKEYKSKLNVGDIFISFGRNKNSKKLDKQALCKVTDIYTDKDIRFHTHWYKEGWTEDGKKSLHRLQKGAGCIEFEVLAILENN